MLFHDRCRRRLRRWPYWLLLLLCLMMLCSIWRLLQPAPGSSTESEQKNPNEDFLLARVRSLPVWQSPAATDSELADNFNNFEHFYRLADRQMDSALHWMDQMGTKLPLMRLSAKEESDMYRAAWAERWLRNESLAVVAAARNALPGLDATIANLLRLCQKLASCSLVFLENDSNDGTRQRLHQLTTQLAGNSRVKAVLLGCGRINSPEPCRLNLSYSTGKRHRPGSAMRRSLLEELERVQVMSALRNQLLAYAYTHLAGRHSLLLSIDPDLYWADWDLTAMLQGLYYFGTRPQLDSLCASSYYYNWGRRTVYDPCTLRFQEFETTGRLQGDQLPLDSDQRRSDAVLYNGARAPVKMSACFQGLTFYRMASLYRSRLLYRKGIGEWICEHNTLSRQLSENYIDPNMQLRVRLPLGPLML